MINAAKYNNITALKTLLDISTTNINSIDSDSYTALMHAAQNGHLEAVQFLLAARAKLEANANDGMTALICAAQNGHVAVVQSLLTASAKLEASANDGMTALMCAAQNGHAAVVQSLLIDGAELNSKQEDGYTALMLAADNGHLAVAQSLLTNGYELESKDNYGMTSLILAAHNGHLAVAQYLVTAGADLNAKDNGGRTALMWAVQNGYLETGQYLVTAGAELEAKEEGGYTALMYAAEEGYVAVAQCLVTAGAELNAKTEKGSTALMLAAENGHLETAQCLVTAGAELNAKDRDGKTALMYATSNGHVAVAQCLVTAGAELEAKSEKGQTALTLAASFGRVAMAQYLVYSGKPWSSSILLLPNYDAATAELYQCLRRVRYRENGLFTSILDNIASLKATPMLSLMGSAAPSMVKYPARIKLLKARICGVVFPEDFTQKLSGMPLEKFNHIVPLMRAAKIAKLVHSVNAYFFTRIFMRESSTSSMLEKMPFDLKANLLDFVLGKAETKTLTRELQAISFLAMASVSRAAALGEAPGSEHSTASIDARVAQIKSMKQEMALLKQTQLIDAGPPCSAEEYCRHKRNFQEMSGSRK